MVSKHQCTQPKVKAWNVHHILYYDIYIYIIYTSIYQRNKCIIYIYICVLPILMQQNALTYYINIKNDYVHIRVK